MDRDWLAVALPVIGFLPVAEGWTLVGAGAAVGAVLVTGIIEHRQYPKPLLQLHGWFGTWNIPVGGGKRLQ